MVTFDKSLSSLKAPAKTIASTNFKHCLVDSGVLAAELFNWHSLLTNHFGKKVNFTNCYVSVN